MLDQTHPTDEQLNTYLDQALSEANRIVLEAHLETCAPCAARLRVLSSLIQEIETLPDLPLERDLAPGVLAAIEAPVHQAAVPAPSTAFRLVLVLQVLTALALLLFAWPVLAGRLPLKLAVGIGEQFTLLFAGRVIAWQMELMDLLAALGDSFGGIWTGWDLLVHLPSLTQASIIQIAILLSVATLLCLIGNGILLRSREAGGRPSELKRRRR